MNGVIAAFAGHRIAPNLLMLLMIVSGFFVIDRFEIRFFPEFRVPVVQVSAVWPGVAAEDVEASLVTPLENELRNVPDLKEITSVAADGLAMIYLEFPDGMDTNVAAEDVRRYLDLVVGSLPSDSEQPEVQTIEFPNEIMRLSLAGNRIDELRRLARQLENDLLALGIVQVDLRGLPDEVIEIRLDQNRLSALGLTPSDIGRQISAQNLDVSAGDLDGAGSSRLLRALSQRESVEELLSILLLDRAGNTVPLGDIAEIVRTTEDDRVEVFFNGRPAVEFEITGRTGGNSLDAGIAVNEWLEKARSRLPPSVSLTAHKQEWKHIRDRLELLVRNGMQGLGLVVLLLFLFLNWRLAFWIGAGIPAVFMVSLTVLYLLGGTIDMLTMFAFIMTTGIVVDDSIVVGENAMYHYTHKREPPMEAAVKGAKEMFAAVLSSTLTTISSFMPLMIIGGPIGAILFVIPLVVICVLTAALFECFTVLPGHLAGAFRKIRPTDERKQWFVRQAIDDGFNWFQEVPFRRFAGLALRYRWITIATAFVVLIFSVSLLIGGIVKYRFFPGADLGRLQAQAEFVSGTPRATVEAYMRQLEEALLAAVGREENLGSYSLYRGQGLPLDETLGLSGGDEIGSIYVELEDSKKRDLSAQEIVKRWRERAPQAAGLENLIIQEESGGPPGEDLKVRLSGGVSPAVLKEATQFLRTALLDVPGVSRPTDDMPYGKKQQVLELTSVGRALNLSIGEVARQLRDAFDGYEVQTFYRGVDETKLRVVLASRGLEEDLAGFQIRLPNDQQVLLSDVVSVSSRRGFQTIQRTNSEPVAHVVGDVDFAVTDMANVIRQLEGGILPEVAATYGVNYSFVGAQKDEQQTAKDMVTGLFIAGLLIFVTLAAVFASWTLPIVIILTAPLAIIGAIFGHWIMDLEMSILSIFGIFTLSGIVINDSIVLVRDYLARKQEQPEADDRSLIADSVCRRFRAILLTTLTTVGGLTPLMFETSTQAQFLIPMAASICFGLAFATLLILFVMPAYLSVHHSMGGVMRKLFSPPVRGHAPAGD